MDASSRRSQMEHAKFLIFQIQENLGKMKSEDDSVIQCKDGCVQVPALLFVVLSPLFQTALQSCGTIDGDSVLILPDLEVGELLLFLKYLLSMNIKRFFAQEDLLIIRKVMKYLEADFESNRRQKQEPKKITVEEPKTKAIPSKVTKERTRELIKKFSIKDKEPATGAGNKENQAARKAEADLPCTFCGADVNPSILAKHIKTHHADLEHACIHCKQSFDSRSDLEEHVQSHPDSPWFKTCQDCKVVSLSMYQHLNHRRVHTSSGLESQKCQHCDKTFVKKSARLAHEEKHLLGKLNKTYACVQCPKTFGKQSNLARHIRSHFGIKNYSCDECNAEFVDSTRLKEHKWIHLDYAKFKCPVSDCPESFRTRSNLKNHLNRKHSEEAKYPCNLCNRMFAFEYKLRNHMRLHEIDEESKLKEKIEETVTEFKDSSVYVCVSCKREFKSIADLGVHCNEYHKPQEPRRKKMKVHQVAKRNKLSDDGQATVVTEVVTEQQANVHTFTTESLPACQVVSALPEVTAANGQVVTTLPVVAADGHVVTTLPEGATAGQVVTTLTAENLSALELVGMGPGMENSGEMHMGPGFHRDETVHLDAETKKHLQILDDIRLETLVEPPMQNNIRLEFLDDLYNADNVDTRGLVLADNMRLNENGQIVMEVNPKDDGLYLSD